MSALDAAARRARERMDDDLNALLKRVVSEEVGHDHWPGDVAPHMLLALDKALEGVIAQLILNGRPRPEESLDQIQGILSAHEWSPDTPEEIAEVIRRSGREVLDLPVAEEAP